MLHLSYLLSSRHIKVYEVFLTLFSFFIVESKNVRNTYKYDANIQYLHPLTAKLPHAPPHKRYLFDMTGQSGNHASDENCGR